MEKVPTLHRLGMQLNGDSTSQSAYEKPGFNTQHQQKKKDDFPLKLEVAFFHVWIRFHGSSIPSSPIK